MYSIVVPPGDRVNDEDDHRKSGIGGWLLVLCLLLVVGQPVHLAIGAARMLGALPIRGLPLGVVVFCQLMVTGIGVGAGLALLGRKRAAATFAKSSLLLSAGMDLFVYSTPYVPNNRLPGTTPLFVLASITYYAIWIAYLSRSTRVTNTFATT
jgi:hypothetical protein